MLGSLGYIFPPLVTGCQRTRANVDWSAGFPRCGWLFAAEGGWPTDASNCCRHALRLNTSCQKDLPLKNADWRDGQKYWHQLILSLRAKSFRWHYPGARLAIWKTLLAHQCPDCKQGWWLSFAFPFCFFFRGKGRLIYVTFYLICSFKCVY